MDTIYEFQLIQSPKTEFKIISEYNDEWRINFNFEGKVSNKSLKITFTIKDLT